MTIEPSQPTRSIDYACGITAIDADFHRTGMAAAYLMQSGDRAAFIEVGTRQTIPHLLAALEHRDLTPEQVAFVIVTHVHLDHCGGAGVLMQQLPNATFVVHPRGARHMIDPAKLEASARQVYGDAEFDRTYGNLIPIPEDRVRIMDDGDTLDFNGRQLGFMDSPGHAKHHFCVWDETSRGWFTGDTFGLSYREFDTDRGAFIFPTTTPIHFDPDALHRSIDGLMARSPDCMYLTHFGQVTETERLAEDMHRRIHRLVDIAERHTDSDDPVAAIASDMRNWLLDELRAHGCRQADERLLELIEPDVQLNAQGIAFWLQSERG